MKHIFHFKNNFLFVIEKLISIRRFQADIKLPIFIAFVSLLNVFLFHLPLFCYAIESFDLLTGSSFSILLMLFLVVFTSSILFWLILCLFHQSFLKPIVWVSFLGNAIALYFITSYQITLDKSMIGNIFTTNWDETRELLSGKLFIFLIVFGLVPIWFCNRIKIKKLNRISVLKIIVLVLSIFIILTYVFSQSWLWFDKHAKKIGGMVLPWSYVVNAVRINLEKNSQNEHQILLTSADFKTNRKTLVFLIIGESARHQNFSLYGYKNKTNMRLNTDEVIALQGTKACATYTTASLKCILSHDDSTSSTFNNFEPLPSYLQRHGVEVHWRTNNWGEPTLKVFSYLRSNELRKNCKAFDCEFDGVLLTDLLKQIQSSDNDKIFVVLHQTGSHGPSYYKKYPPQFEKFTPTCKTVELSKCTSEELRNAYDNTIFYTDYFIGRVIDIAKNFSQFETSVIYISDHGESLGEFGLYLHGTPYTIAPDFQKEIPFTIWMSNRFQHIRAISVEKIKAKTNTSHANIFHTVMGAFDMRSPVYNKKMDLFATENDLIGDLVHKK